jgi:hypothetical protein
VYEGGGRRGIRAPPPTHFASPRLHVRLRERERERSRSSSIFLESDFQYYSNTRFTIAMAMSHINGLVRSSLEIHHHALSHLTPPSIRFKHIKQIVCIHLYHYSAEMTLATITALPHSFRKRSDPAFLPPSFSPSTKCITNMWGGEY